MRKDHNEHLFHNQRLMIDVRYVLNVTLCKKFFYNLFLFSIAVNVILTFQIN